MVELSRQEFHGDVLHSGKVALVGDTVGDYFSEHAIAAFFEQVFSEAEKVIDVQQPEAVQGKLEIFIQFIEKASGLHLEFRIFFYEYAVILHNDRWIRNDGRPAA